MKIKLTPLALMLLFATPVMADTAHTQTTPGTKKPPVVTQPVNQTTNPEVEHMQAEHEMSGQQLLGLIAESKDYLPFDIDVPGQAFVSTGPYVGVPIQFAGSNLVVNSPSVNTDIQLLTIRKKIHAQLMAMGGSLFKEPYHSHLLLSGIVEAQMNYTHERGGNNSSYIDITNVSIDAFFIGPSDWSLGFIELTYDNASPINSPYGSTYHSQFTDINSRIYVNKAFITIGDFTRSPFYGTIGQYYVPFGVYSSAMVSDTLPKNVARTKARALELGFYQQTDNALYGSVYIFKGDTYPGPENQVNSGGLNLGYKFDCGIFSGTIGGGIIANVADSVGMQAATGFMSYEKIKHRVPFYNVNANIGIASNWDVIFEFVGPTTRFNVNDMSYNYHGAKPWALDVQGNYSFYMGTHPSSVGLGYAQSSQALAMGIPRKRYSAVLNTSIWRNTLQSIEFRHDEQYSKHAVANGPVGAQAADILNKSCTSYVCSTNGRPDNSITAQFDYYF